MRETRLWHKGFGRWCDAYEPYDNFSTLWPSYHMSMEDMDFATNLLVEQDERHPPHCRRRAMVYEGHTNMNYSNSISLRLVLSAKKKLRKVILIEAVDI